MGEAGRRLIDEVPGLYRYARLVAGSSDQAQEAVLHVCREALRRRVETGRLPALMHSALAALAALAELVDPPASAGNLPPIGEADPNSTPERLLQHIRGLPPAQREVLLLVCGQRLGYRTAAEVMQSAMDGIVDHLLTARRRLGSVAALEGADTAHDDDATFMAFADGELNERARQGVERAMDANEAFVERTALFIRSSALAAEALDTMLEDPVPSSLDGAVRQVIRDAMGQPRGLRAALAGLFSGRRID